uniref:CBM20 domain-containing protein n=1 Tax=Chromera velia CCMP2878 TaxID=1169474 RepID=A0A0G4HC16_9ALVE|eukprot:Cvel_25969.t1-p1 / transcript=Cvel_25969.t1 / gene=Cvel_25969 / organism=Chromera_velia_CCMP2878 / gene_product=Zinc finger protein 283, putative / transcript_product=Zinc finger protein 283, putative / location=Cvel_scaffold3014:583-2586(+) / protein_length=668 / sequence_SO=supercontig / SO=protein_coding / is_pseudo=false
MKGGIAFVAFCPEVRENQRVIVVGDCPELGGWELGGAVCMRPAPCGRPWWVLSEVEVNLSGCTMGASGGLAGGVETEREVERVKVSELKFRLVAIPNAGDVAQLPDSHKFVCLEPLRGGDFRIVRFVGAPPPADCSSAGERGDNTIRVGEGGGGEQQQQRSEVVGIAVEWGVPESVQLALLPRSTNAQSEHSQRETVNEHSCLSVPQSESACVTSSDGVGEGESEMFGSTDDTLAVSVSSSQSAVEVRGCDSQRGMGGGDYRGGESGRQNQREKESEKNSDCSETVADIVTDNRILPSHLSSSTHLSSHDCTLTQRQQEEGQQTRGLPLKRRRSEIAVSQVEADVCDGVSGCCSHRRDIASRGGGRDGVCLREEKQRRLSVSVTASDSAPLSSKAEGARGGAIAGEKEVVCENRRWGGREGEEVKRNRHGQIVCLHGRVRSQCKECGGRSICEHGRIRSRCKECGGGGICEHGRIRSRCKECGGSGICEHGRKRSQCKECGGKSICEHGRRRSQCKECGGSSFCEHGRRRSLCKECGGKSICEHGRHRSQCKECGGANICEHGRQRCKCKECGGKSICEHGRERYSCKECGGKSICEHGRKRPQCKECGGASICEHGRVRNKCKACGGKSICEHGRYRYYCKECGGNGICAHKKERRYCRECNAHPAS